MAMYRHCRHPARENTEERSAFGERVARVFLLRVSAEAQGFPRVKMLSQPFCPVCTDVEKELEVLQDKYIVCIENFNVRNDNSSFQEHFAA